MDEKLVEDVFYEHFEDSLVEYKEFTRQLVAKKKQMAVTELKEQFSQQYGDGMVQAEVIKNMGIMTGIDKNDDG